MGTSNIANAIAALIAASAVQTATLNPVVDDLGLYKQRRAFLVARPSTIIWPDANPLGGLDSLPVVTPFIQILRAERETTPREQLIGELRRWRMLTANWDGEGALAADKVSSRAAEAFTDLLPDGLLPEPMLHAGGRAGLYWKTDDLYADLEFLDGQRIAYYIERAGDKHKGVVNYDANNEEMPPVLAILLQA
jgi:hypothetical protein